MNGWAAIARLGGLGDNLVAASVARPLKRMGYKVEVITTPKAGAVFRNNPNIDRITIKGDADFPKGADWQKWFVERAKEYDHFVHLSHSIEGRHALFSDSTAFWWPEDYRRQMCAGSYLETAHDIAGVPHDFGPLYYPTDEERENARIATKKAGDRFLGWVICGSRPDKGWPYSTAAIPRIIKELNIPVVLMGVGDDQKKMAEKIAVDCKIANSDRDMLHIAVATEQPDGTMSWNLRTSLAVIMASSIVVTPDTGSAWAVAMEDMAKVVMVSHTSVENITKHWKNTTTLHADPDRVSCWPCHRLHDTFATCRKMQECEAAACMGDISVETVIEAVRKAMFKDVVIREAAE